MKQIQSIFDVNIGDILIYKHWTPCIVIGIDTDKGNLFVFAYNTDFSVPVEHLEKHLKCSSYTNFYFNERFKNRAKCTMYYPEDVGIKLNITKVSKLEQKLEFEE